MRDALEQPGTIRYVVVVLVGLPVALVVSRLYPDRQGTQFVPFLVTIAAALIVVWLIGHAIERLWLARADAAAERDRRRGRR